MCVALGVTCACGSQDSNHCQGLAHGGMLTQVTEEQRERFLAASDIGNSPHQLSMQEELARQQPERFVQTRWFPRVVAALGPASRLPLVLGGPINMHPVAQDGNENIKQARLFK